MLALAGWGTNSHILFSIRALYSFSIANFQLESERDRMWLVGKGDTVQKEVEKRLNNWRVLKMPCWDLVRIWGEDKIELDWEEDSSEVETGSGLGNLGCSVGCLWKKWKRWREIGISRGGISLERREKLERKREKGKLDSSNKTF